MSIYIGNNLDDWLKKQPTVQGWSLHYKDFWENFHISGFLCYKFIVLLSDFTLYLICL